MDPKTIEINNLRVLNDYLNQTIDVLLRSQRLGAGTSTIGLSHSPAASLFASPMTGFGVDPTLGLSHSPYAAHTSAFGTPFQTGFGVTPYTSPFAPTYPSVVDPFNVQRGLSHSSVVGALNPLNEIARQQQILQAMLARQQVEAAIARTWGIPV